MDIPGWPGQSAPGFGGTIYGGGRPGDFTPWVGGGPPAGGQDPNQTIPPIIIPPSIGDLGGGRAGSYPPLTGSPPPTTSTSGGAPVSSSGIDWTNVLSGLGKAIQGGIQGYMAPRGQGGQGGRDSQGRTPQAAATPAAPQVNTQAPIIPVQMTPQSIPGSSAAATAPISITQMPSGAIAPLPDVLTQGRPAMPTMGTFEQGGIIPYLPYLGAFQSGGIIPLLMAMMQQGQAGQGAVVPQTGLYPVRGGEHVVPRHRVKKKEKRNAPAYRGTSNPRGTAQLHAGEIVRPPGFMGSYQSGGTISSDGTPMTPEEQATVTDVYRRAAEQAKARQQTQTQQLPLNLPGGTIVEYPENLPAGSTIGGKPANPSLMQRVTGMLGGLRATQQQQQASAAALPAMGGAMFPAKFGPSIPTPAAPQVNTVGGAFGTSGGIFGGGTGQLPVQIPQMGQVPGIPQGAPPMQPGAAGGPMAYAGGSALPPYQNQFAPRGRAQYVTQNLLGGLNNAFLLYKQKEYDKTVERAQAGAMNKMQRAEEAAQRQQQQQATAPQQDQGPGSAYQPSQSRLSQFLQQQGMAPQATAGPRGQNRPGQERQPGPGAMPQMSNEEQQTYQNLLKQDPQMAQKFLRNMDRREKQDMKDYAKALSDPTSPQYRGYMLAYQEKQKQQTARAEMETKVAQANTARLQAETAAAEQSVRTDVLKQMYGSDPQSNGAAMPQDKGLALAYRSPWGPAIRQMAPFRSDEMGILNGAVTDWAFNDNKNAIPQAMRDIFNQRNIASRPRVLALGDGTYQWFVYDPQSRFDVPLGQPMATPPPGTTVSAGEPNLNPGQTPQDGGQTAPPGGGQTAPPAVPQPINSQTGTQLGVPSMPGDTAEQQSSTIPSAGQIATAEQATNQRGLLAGPKVYKNINILAFDPKAGPKGRWRMATPKMVADNKWLFPTKQYDMAKDRTTEEQLNDTTKKMLRYEDSFRKDLGWKDQGALSMLISQDANLSSIFWGQGEDPGWMQKLQESWLMNHVLSPEAQYRIWAFANAKEALLGYNRVLAGSARAGQYALSLNINVVPNPLMSTGVAHGAMAQFKENIPTIAQGLPMLPGIDNPEDILSGKIDWKKETPSAGYMGQPPTTTTPTPTPSSTPTPPSPKPSAGANIIQNAPTGAVNRAPVQGTNEWHWLGEGNRDLGRAPAP